MLKLVNRTLGVPVVRLLFAWTFATLPLVFLLLVLRILLRSLSRSIPFTLSLSLFFLCSPAASSATRRALHPRLRGSDNGGSALSSWFIASFDCQVHAGESTQPFPPSPSLPCRARCFLSCASSPTSSDSFRVARRILLRFPCRTYGDRECARECSYTSLDRGHARSEFMSSDILSVPRIPRTRKTCNENCNCLISRSQIGSRVY